ncbi:hypothetical protein COCNU_12G005630 [Cocos nucifera]|uniref:Uncharacterized protein n=1 Tax=Cocos nucifera TaxID=13894 RepID=A0A8K0IS89_COCNU|nr:hypothetical protein COCNU_12G005630 [Cocos nucifera]
MLAEITTTIPLLQLFQTMETTTRTAMERDLIVYRSRARSPLEEFPEHRRHCRCSSNPKAKH